MKKIKGNKKIIIVLILGLIWSSLFIIETQRYILQSKEYGYKANNKESGIDYTNSTTYNLFNARVTALESKVYPVGSVYISLTKSTTSQVVSLFGGTWVAIGQGRVLIGAGTNGTYTFEAGSTGGSTVAGNSSSGTQTITNPLGEYTHKLVVNEMPSHTHNYYKMSGGASLKDTASGSAYGDNVFSATTSAGNDYYHNNIQPYLVVYMYKRTA